MTTHPLQADTGCCGQSRQRLRADDALVNLEAVVRGAVVALRRLQAQREAVALSAGRCPLVAPEAPVATDFALTLRKASCSR